jgi:hypothetical protein
MVSPEEQSGSRSFTVFSTGSPAGSMTTMTRSPESRAQSAARFSAQSTWASSASALRAASDWS